MTVRSTLRHLKNMEIEMPTDVRQIEKLVASGLVLTGLALGDLVHRRFKLIALGACGLLAASAFGLSPMAFFTTKGSGDEECDADCSDEKGSDEQGFDDEREIAPEEVGVPAIAKMGVPHRIPEEVGLDRSSAERSSPRIAG